MLLENEMQYTKIYIPKILFLEVSIQNFSINFWTNLSNEANEKKENFTKENVTPPLRAFECIAFPWKMNACIHDVELSIIYLELN